MRTETKIYLADLVKLIVEKINNEAVDSKDSAIDKEMDAIKAEIKNALRNLTVSKNKKYKIFFISETACMVAHFGSLAEDWVAGEAKDGSDSLIRFWLKENDADESVFAYKINKNSVISIELSSDFSVAYVSLETDTENTEEGN